MSFRDAVSGKKKKKARPADDDSPPAPASTAVFKEALLQDQKSKLERDGKRFADLEDEIALLRAEHSALKEVLTPLVKSLGKNEKEFELEDGRRLVIEKVGGGRSATRTAIVERWPKSGPEFWESLEKRPGYDNLKAKGPKEH